MAEYNKTLGRFELVGIPPAPRGMPQVEVTFDIDANGIVHVSAKDLGTGKEQSIEITASSGLTEEEIDTMVKEAEIHSAEDKSKKALAEARNQADALIYSTEKTLKEHGDSVDASEKQSIEEAIAKVKKEMEGSDVQAIESACEALSSASHKLAEAMYAKASQSADSGAAGTDEESAPRPSDEDVVDADFEEVKDDK